MSNRKASTSIVSFAHQIFRVERTPFQKQKASIPWPELPERLASNSSVHFPLYRNGSRSLVRPHITQEAFSMAGQACYGRQISHEESLSRCIVLRIQFDLVILRSCSEPRGTVVGLPLVISGLFHYLFYSLTNTFGRVASPVTNKRQTHTAGQIEERNRNGTTRGFSVLLPERDYMSLSVAIGIYSSV